MKKLLFVALLACFFAAPANAQQPSSALILSSCGSAAGYVAGTYGIITMDTNGKLCDSGSGGGGTQNVNLIQWASVTLGAATGWGVAPSGNVPGVNANVLASVLPTGAATQTTLAAILAAQGAAPAQQTGATVGIVAGSQIIGKAGIDQTTPGTTNGVSIVAAPLGGATPYHIASAASNNSTNVKSTAGTVYDLTLINTTTTLGDFRFYDSASAPTCSSATGVVNNLPVQSNAISPGIHLNYPGGKLFANGISFCYTGAVADNDNTNAATGVQINIDYK